MNEIRDWDLWPWMVADGVGGLNALRMERAIGRMQVAIGSALLPAMRAANRAFQRFAVANRDLLKALSVETKP